MFDSSDDFESAVPNAASLIQSLRAFGYDISTAIADLIDNSITVKAQTISIVFVWQDGNPWVAVIDDGTGMDEKELFEAMRLGSRNPLEVRDQDDLGRFGLGLKTASFSQCRRLTVVSKKSNGIPAVRCWDLDFVMGCQDWRLLKNGSNVAESLTEKHLDNKTSGTIVLWEKIDRIVPDDAINDPAYQKEFLECANRVKTHVSVVFSSYMQGRQKTLFSINNRPIEMWDPFLLGNEHTSAMPGETLLIGNKKVDIKPYILPHHNKLSAEEFSGAAGVRGWTQSQGFYVYRNNRLIISGNWLLPEFQNKEQYRLARIRIDIANDLDEEWGIDVKKSIAVPPVSIQSEIRRIAIAAQRESARIFRHRGKKLARTNKNEHAFVWSQIVRNGKLGYSINKEHFFVKRLLCATYKKDIEQLIELIEETVPVPLIISDHSDKPDEMLSPFEGKAYTTVQPMLLTLYENYIDIGYAPEKAIKSIATCEPFIYYPEIVELFRETKGIEIND